MPNMLEVIKNAAMEAVNASEPAGIIYGTVTSVNPLAIFLDQKQTLDSDFLILTKNVTDHTVEMTVNHNTDEASGGSGEKAFESHSHGYTGRKTITVHNGLKVGDKVIMIKQQGGQSYIVLDKVGGAK